MKKIAAVVLSFFFVLMSVSAAFAADASRVYYVDAVSGNDEAAGTSPEEAWQTLSKASSVTFGPGDRLLLRRGGTYQSGFTTHGSGSASEPVTVSSYGEGNLPVITTSSANAMFFIENVSNWVVDGLEFTAPGGKGAIRVYAYGGANTENVTVKNCVIHDISSGLKEDMNAAVFIDNDKSSSRVKNLHLDGLRIYNVAWGIQMNGIMDEFKNGFQSPEASYNRDFLFENLYVQNATFGGIVFASVQDAVLRNSRFLNCATSNNGALAPVWTRHVDRVTVEYCEIAGSTNLQDGMAVDFDGWSTNSTYRYIYSHNNTRFMRNCVYDSGTKNSGNSVYNCVSVNDNGGMSFAASTLISFRKPSYSWMSNFTFHDNIFVNSSPIIWLGASGPQVYNISFRGNVINVIMQRILNVISSVGQFNYSVDDDALNAAIAEITANLPN